ncbi:MAG: hypothetical protein WA172_17260 [Terriglobales bacterium]
MSGIVQLCEWAARLGAVIVSVRASRECWSAQASTPNHCVFTLDSHDYLSMDEKRILYAHIKNGGSVIFLNFEYADDPSVLAHELGHVAAFLAGRDCDYRKPTPKLARRAQRCGMDWRATESRDELMAECVAWRMLDLPLSPLLCDFCETAFSEFTRRTGWQSRWSCLRV